MKCETIDNYTEGLLCASIIMMFVILVQIKYPNFIVQGNPIIGVCWIIGFMVTFLVLHLMKKINKCD